MKKDCRFLKQGLPAQLATGPPMQAVPLQAYQGQYQPHTAQSAQLTHYPSQAPPQYAQYSLVSYQQPSQYHQPQYPAPQYQQQHQQQAPRQDNQVAAVNQAQDGQGGRNQRRRRNQNNNNNNNGRVYALAQPPEIPDHSVIRGII